MKNEQKQQIKAQRREKLAQQRQSGLRQLRRGSFASAAVAVLLIILILINVVVSKLPDSVTRLDITGKNLYSIGEQSKSIAQNLNQPVTVYWIAAEGYEDSGIEELLNRYVQAADGNITLTRIDPVTNPNFAAKYTEGNITQNTLVVESAQRYKVVAYTDIYQTEYGYDSSYNMTTSTTFCGEGEITAALDYVTSDSLPTVYYLSGHGEPGLPSDLENSLKRQNITTQELTLITADDIPEDCGTLIVDSPTSDLYPDEAEKINDWMASGGQLLLFTTYGTQELPNLAKITAQWGLTLQQGAVVEGDRNSYYQYPIYILPKLAAASTITSNLASSGQYVLAYLPQAIAADEEYAQDVTFTYLLTSSSDSYIMQDLENSTEFAKGEEDPTGPFNLAVQAENSTTGAKLVWFADGYLTNSELNSWTGGTNYTLLINTVGYLTEHDSAIAIEGISLDTESLLITTAQAGFWKGIYTVLLPLGVVIIGASVLVRRKRCRA